MTKKIIYPAIAFIIIFLSWEYSGLFFENQALVLPPPVAIVKTIFSRWDRFLYHSGVTLKEMIGGFLLAFLASFPLAWSMYSWSPARLVLQPFFVFIQCIPMFALAPIMVIWFGWGYTAIVIPTALMIFFPLTINIYQGLRSTPQTYIDYFRINQATNTQIFYKLQLPWAIPQIFAGFRIAAAIAGVGAVAGEWAGAQAGLGILMLESRRSTDLETTFGALFCLTLISTSLYGFILLLEKFVVNYRPVASKILVVVISFLGLTLGGCQQQPTSQQVTNLMLDWLPNPNHIPFYVGVEKGFFSDQGIPLALIKLADAGGVLPYITSGEVQMALHYMPPTIRAVHRGIDVKPIGVVFKQPLNSFIYRANEGISKPEDLEGKVVGYCVDGTATAVLDFLLSQNDIKIKEKRNVTFDLVSTLGTRQVDCIYGAYWNIECEHLGSMGIKTNHFEISDFNYPLYYELIVIAKGDSPQTQPEYVERFQAALQQSINYSLAHPEEAFEIYLKSNLDKSEKTIAWEKKAWAKTYPVLAKDQHMDQKVWDNMSDWLKQHKINY